MATRKKKSPEETARNREISNRNLKRGNPETQFAAGRVASEMGKKGAKRSHEVQREKRTARQMLEEIMSYKPTLTPVLRAGLANMGADPDKGDYTAGFLSFVALQQKAMKGDVRALQMWLEITGQDPRTIIEQDRLALEKQNASHVPGFAALDAAVDEMNVGEDK